MIYTIRHLIFILLLGICFSSDVHVGQDAQMGTVVTKILNDLPRSEVQSVFCQAVGLLYRIPHLRRCIMNRANGNRLQYFLGDFFFRLEVPEFKDSSPKAPSPSLIRSLENVKDVLQSGLGISSEIGQVFWKTLWILGLAQRKNSNSPIEMACFGENGLVSQVSFECVERSNPAEWLNVVNNSEYLVVFLGENSQMDWSVFENHEVLVALVKIGGKLTGLSTFFFQDHTAHLYAAVLKKKNLAVEIQLPPISDEIYEKFKYPALSPTTKLSFPSEPPLWFPLAEIPIQLRLLALIPEARGHLLQQAIEFNSRSGPGPGMFTIESFYNGVSDSTLKDRLCEICGFKIANGPFRAADIQWILNTSRCASLKNTETLPPWIFVQPENAKSPFPATLKCGEMTYKLHVSVIQDISSNLLIITAPGGTPNYKECRYKWYDETKSGRNSNRERMGIYRCDEKQRVHHNTKNCELLGVGNDDHISLEPLKVEACSPKFLAVSFVFHMKAIFDGLMLNQTFQAFQGMNFTDLKPIFDKYCKSEELQATGTFQEIYDKIIVGQKLTCISKDAKFLVSGFCSLNGTAQTFEFYFPTLPDELDLTKSLSLALQDLLEGKSFNSFENYSAKIKPGKLEGVMKNVQIWNIQYPSYFLKNYSAYEADGKEASYIQISFFDLYSNIFS